MIFSRAADLKKQNQIPREYMCASKTGRKLVKQWIRRVLQQKGEVYVVVSLDYEAKMMDEEWKEGEEILDTQRVKMLPIRFALAMIELGTLLAESGFDDEGELRDGWLCWAQVDQGASLLFTLSQFQQERDMKRFEFVHEEPQETIERYESDLMMYLEIVVKEPSDDDAACYALIRSASVTIDDGDRKSVSLMGLYEARAEWMRRGEARIEGE